MPSGKRARQQRRQAVAAPPPVRVKGGPGLGARQASPRTLAIAGGVIVLVIVAVVLGIVLSSGSSSPDLHSDTPTIHIVNGVTTGSSEGPYAYSDAPDVATLLKGIPQHEFVLGDPNAPVTLMEYIDLQCPVCDDFEVNEFGNLVTKFVRPGKLKIVMKPWNILDARDATVDSLRGQKATIAAARQNLAFNFAQVLYDNQQPEGTGWMDDLAISNIAASVDGLKLGQFQTDANSLATAQLIHSIDAYANARTPPPGVAGSQQYPFAGTPTLFLTKGKGTPQYYGTGWGAPPMDQPSLESAITRLLSKK